VDHILTAANLVEAFPIFEILPAMERVRNSSKSLWDISSHSTLPHYFGKFKALYMLRAGIVYVGVCVRVSLHLSVRTKS